MAITLGSVVLSDAEVTDGIGFGDVAAAARLWVGHWPIALSAARAYVEPAEVPGLAAEALVGTIAAIAVGRGPREDLTAFVVDAVTELGEGEEPSPASRTATPPPEVFTSALMTRAFTGLPAEDQEVLRLTIAGEQSDRLIAEARNIPLADAVEVRHGALTALQRDYLAEHTEHAEQAACRQAHGAMAAAVARGASLPGGTWVHMSECAWCTEAFHELAFSNVALPALVDSEVLTPVVPAGLDAVVAPAVVIPGLQETGGLDPVPTMEPTDGAEPPLAPPVPPETVDVVPAAAASRRGFLRSRRTRIAAGALLATAAITVAVLAVTGPDDPARTPAAAQTDQGPDPTELPDVFESVAPPTIDGSPTPSTSAPAPAPTPTAVVVPDAAPAPVPSPAATPRPQPSPAPPTTTAPAPSPTAPATTADPTPTPTPTAAPCNGLQRLLGFC